MQSEVATQVQVTLTMNRAEAQWLRGLMQNPVFANEDEYFRNMRQTFFDAIPCMETNPILFPDGVR